MVSVKPGRLEESAATGRELFVRRQPRTSGQTRAALSEAMTMALTAVPAFIAVWLRLRTGSVLLPVLLHNLGNSVSLVL